jgi:hypothetical protein
MWFNTGCAVLQPDNLPQAWPAQNGVHKYHNPVTPRHHRKVLALGGNWGFESLQSDKLPQFGGSAKLSTGECAENV